MSDLAWYVVGMCAFGYLMAVVLAVAPHVIGVWWP